LFSRVTVCAAPKGEPAKQAAKLGASPPTTAEIKDEFTNLDSSLAKPAKAVKAKKKAKESSPYAIDYQVMALDDLRVSIEDWIVGL
jgi:hypothetical protein